jgi:hypothetical protein
VYVTVGRVHATTVRVHATIGQVSGIVGRVLGTVGRAPITVGRRRGEIVEEYHTCLMPYRAIPGQCSPVSHAGRCSPQRSSSTAGRSNLCAAPGASTFDGVDTVDDPRRSHP